MLRWSLTKWRCDRVSRRRRVPATGPPARSVALKGEGRQGGDAVDAPAIPLYTKLGVREDVLHFEFAVSIK